MKTLQHLVPPETLEVTGDLGVSISGITYDSRRAGPGLLFVALTGANVDGHTFISQAVAQGAAAVLVEKPVAGLPVPVIRVPDTRKALSFMAAAFFDRPSENVTLIGVTGTKGKTTTTYLIQSILKRRHGQAFRFGTVEHDLGKIVLPAKNTTPESLDLMTLLHDAAQSGSRAGVMEVSSHALKGTRVSHLQFAAAGFTNLSLEHTEFHPNMEDYFLAKRRLFTELLPQGRRAVVNLDDAYGERLANELRAVGVPLTGISLQRPDADLRVENLQITGTRSSFTFIAEGASHPCTIALPGHFNVSNALMAAALCRAVGADWAQIIAGLQDVERVPGRFETIRNERGVTVIVDYAHSPQALENVIKAARPLAIKRVITVFGCGGNRSHEKRPVMGKIAAELSDVAIVTSDNPRREKPEDIIEMIMGGVRQVPENARAEIHVEADRRKAIGLAVALAQSGDVLLIAGKGHETGQTFADKVVPFDDREMAREFLQGEQHV
jgi:UDP-N-acetylmuramoyl-L-alanyl-D-glutamate--2,6-diaminopimelate ligase